MKELDPFKLMFIEEPVLSEHYEALKELAPLTSTPIALGERLFSRWDFKRVLADGYVDIIQPDPSHAGGITETRKIAAMAEAYDVALALHCPLAVSYTHLDVYKRQASTPARTDNPPASANSLRDTSSLSHANATSATAPASASVPTHG